MKRLVESTNLGAKGKGRLWHCRFISEGAGSSAFYPGEILEKYGAVALPKGTHVYFNHLTESEMWDRNGSHDVRDFVGVLTEDPVYNEAEKCLEGPVEFIDAALPLIEQAHEYVALSVDIRRFELEEQIDGPPVVTELGYSPLNNIAVVPRGGRDGKVLSLIESYREENTPERKPMNEAEIKALAEALVKGLAPALEEALKPAPVEEQPVEVDLVGVLEEAFAEELPAAARKRVAKAAQAGEDYKALIEAEKADVEAIRNAVLQEQENGVLRAGSEVEDLDNLSIFGGDK